MNVINKQEDLSVNFKNSNKIIVIPTIEGAHIFNSGLSDFGCLTSEEEVLGNVFKIKKLKFSPLFITFAHNFNNELCGHAPSLKELGKLVDQSVNLNTGFTSLGYKVLEKLLDDSKGERILIDIKHMSLQSRLEYYKYLMGLEVEIPIIVSHGAVTGTDYEGNSNTSLNPDFFVNESINFYDEELVLIAKSNGLFAIQFDAKRLARLKFIKKPIFNKNTGEQLKKSAKIIWRQIQHIAEVLDAHGFPAWDNCCIGSDFDGTINPLNEVWTSTNFNIVANELVICAQNYLSTSNTLILSVNKNIEPYILVQKFAIDNTINFLNKIKS